jgi:hypothetical protein
MKMHTTKGRRWFVVPGGQVAESVAQRLLERPDVQPFDAGLLPGHDQTFKLSANWRDHTDAARRQRPREIPLAATTDHEDQMSNELTNIVDDGWLDVGIEASQRVLRGSLLRFADWNWTVGKEHTPVEKGTQLVAIGVAAGWVKWQGGKPVETRLRQPGQKLAEREELPDLEQLKWEKGPDGQYRDPWQSTRFVYLIDPKTAEAFTFSTSSWGGREAVINLGDAIARMRSVRPSATPVVTLDSAPMPTRYGRKSKPVFKIVDWNSTSNNRDKEGAIIEHASPLDDDCPF